MVDMVLRHQQTTGCDPSALGEMGKLVQKVVAMSIPLLSLSFAIWTVIVFLFWLIWMMEPWAAIGSALLAVGLMWGVFRGLWEADMKQLTDDDPMPWGKHAGKPMRDIPAAYLFYMWTDGGRCGPLEKRTNCPVADYIRRNLKLLEKEYPDGIWTKE